MTIKAGIKQVINILASYPDALPVIHIIANIIIIATIKEKNIRIFFISFF